MPEPTGREYGLTAAQERKRELQRKKIARKADDALAVDIQGQSAHVRGRDAETDALVEAYSKPARIIPEGVRAKKKWPIMSSAEGRRMMNGGKGGFSEQRRYPASTAGETDNERLAATIAIGMEENQRRRQWREARASMGRREADVVDSIVLLGCDDGFGRRDKQLTAGRTKLAKHFEMQHKAQMAADAMVQEELELIIHEQVRRDVAGACGTVCDTAHARQIA